MKLITPSQIIDFTSLGYVVKTENYDLPKLVTSSYHIIGSDGEITFTNGLNDKVISVTLTHLESAELAVRRYLFSKIKAAILEGGFLIFDYEPQVKWKAKALDGAKVKFNTSYDTIVIDFTVSPLGVNSFDEENVTWGEADVIWQAAEMAWGGSQNTFTASDENIVVENLGNYPSKPTIKITGTGNISLATGGKTLTITGLNGTIYVDGERMIVYDDSKINKMTLTNATFLVLLPGENTVTVTGTAEIVFIDKSRWV